MMKEKTIEQKLIQTIKAAGGMCPKWVSPGLAGVPDRMVLLPGGKIAFVEVKAPGQRMRPLQEKRKQKLESLGFRVFTIDSIYKIKEILDEVYTL